MKTRIYLTRPKEIKTGVYISIAYNNQRTKFYLPDIEIKPTSWNNDLQRLKNGTGSGIINSRIDKYESDIKELFYDYKKSHEEVNPSHNIFKDILEKYFKLKSVQETFFDYFQKFIDLTKTGQRIDIKGNRVAPESGKHLQQTYDHLKAFQTYFRKSIDFDTIDRKFYNSLIEFFNHENLAANTQGAHIQRLKVVLNAATREGLNKNIQFQDFAKPKAETDSIYLTEEERSEFAKLPLNGELDQIRDLFVISMYTGLRYSDGSQLNTHFTIKDGFLYGRQQKTGGKVVIPLHPVVKAIINKYNGAFPKPKANQVVNRGLKEIAKQIKSMNTFESITEIKGGVTIVKNIPRYELTSSHTARRTFASLSYLAGFPTLTIAAITGHRTESSLIRYIKISKEEHAKIIQAEWAKENNLIAIK